MNIYNQVREAVRDEHVVIELSNKGLFLVVHSEDWVTDVSMAFTWDDVETAKYNIIAKTITKMKAQLDGLPEYLVIIK